MKAQITMSTVFLVMAAILFAVGAIEAKPHDFDNVTFDMCLGLFLLALGLLLP